MGTEQVGHITGSPLWPGAPSSESHSGHTKKSSAETPDLRFMEAPQAEHGTVSPLWPGNSFSDSHAGQKKISSDLVPDSPLPPTFS